MQIKIKYYSQGHESGQKKNLQWAEQQTNVSVLLPKYSQLHDIIVCPVIREKQPWYPVRKPSLSLRSRVNPSCPGNSSHVGKNKRV